MRPSELEQLRADSAELERLRAELRAWIAPPTGGMGAGLHAEKWPFLAPSSRLVIRRLLEGGGP